MPELTPITSSPASSSEPAGPARDAAFRLGPWTVRPTLNQIEQAGDAVRMGAKVMDFLLLLAARPGAVVSKKALVESIWDGAHVTDEVITTTVYALRRALGDDARQPRFVATVRGRGYRLVARPTPCRRPDAAPVVRAPSGRRDRPRNAPGRWLVAAALAMSLVVGLAMVWWNVPAANAADVALDPQAAEALALGRHFLRRGSLDDLEKARRHLEAVVARAPSHAGAHMALADAWLEAAPSLPPPRQATAFRQAARSAERALAADRDLPDAHRALGWISLQHARDPAAAAWRFGQSDSAARGGERHLARYLSARGAHTHARSVMARHVAEEPASKTARLAFAEVLYRGRAYGAALRELDRAGELDGSDPEVARLRVDVLSALGHHSDALQACRRDLELSGAPAATSSELGSVFSRAGFRGAQRFLFGRLASAAESPPDPVRLARLSSRFGDAETALAWLDQAFDEGRGDLVWLEVDPAYDAVRSTPRFRNLVERLGLRSSDDILR